MVVREGARRPHLGGSSARPLRWRRAPAHESGRVRGARRRVNRGDRGVSVARAARPRWRRPARRPRRPADARSDTSSSRAGTTSKASPGLFARDVCRHHVRGTALRAQPAARVRPRRRARRARTGAARPAPRRLGFPVCESPRLRPGDLRRDPYRARCRIPWDAIVGVTASWATRCVVSPRPRSASSTRTSTRRLIAEGVPEEEVEQQIFGIEQNLSPFMEPMLQRLHREYLVEASIEDAFLHLTAPDDEAKSRLDRHDNRLRRHRVVHRARRDERR